MSEDQEDQQYYEKEQAKALKHDMNHAHSHGHGHEKHEKHAKATHHLEEKPLHTGIKHTDGKNSHDRHFSKLAHQQDKHKN